MTQSNKTVIAIFLDNHKLQAFTGPFPTGREL